MSWHEQAACAGPEGKDIDWVPTEMEVGGQRRQSLANLTRARRLCASCPVRGTCLDEAVRDNLEGIWAGTTISQRRRIRREFVSPRFRDEQQLRRLEKEITRRPHIPQAPRGEVSA